MKWDRRCESRSNAVVTILGVLSCQWSFTSAKSQCIINKNGPSSKLIGEKTRARRERVEMYFQ